MYSLDLLEPSHRRGDYRRNDLVRLLLSLPVELLQLAYVAVVLKGYRVRVERLRILHGYSGAVEILKIYRVGVDVIIRPYRQRYHRPEREFRHELAVQNIEQVDELKLTAKDIIRRVLKHGVTSERVGILSVFDEPHRHRRRLAPARVSGAVINTSAVPVRIAAKEILIVRGARVHIRYVGERVVYARRLDSEGENDHLRHRRTGYGLIRAEPAC